MVRGDPDKQCARGTAIMSQFVMRDLQEIRPCNIFFSALCVQALRSATMCTIHLHTYYHTNRSPNQPSLASKCGTAVINQHAMRQRGHDIVGSTIGLGNL